MSETEDEIFRYARFNLDAVLSMCTTLRGRPCTCDRSETPKSGSLSWTIFVSFDDGVEWVFRAPRRGYYEMPSDKSASKIVVSEAATLKYLKVNTSIPVPEVYAYSGTWDNDTGVPYILMSKAHGRTLSEYDWAPIKTPGYTALLKLLPVPNGARKKVLGQVGAMMAQLSTIRFDKIGSIIEEEGGCSVSECLSPPFVWKERDSLEDINRGPFSEENQYLDSLISLFTAHATELPMTPHAFFAPIPVYSEYPNWGAYREALESSRNRLAYCIAGQFLREMIPRLVAGDSIFTLSHPDLHVGNIFVDEEFNVTCIIDWGSASTGPVTELLCTPKLGSESESLTAVYRSAFNQIGPEYWEKADMMGYLTQLVRMLSLQDYKYFRGLYEIAHGVKDPDISGLFRERASTEGNRRLLAELKEDDLSREELTKEEDQYGIGRADAVESTAVARKLTVMMEEKSYYYKVLTIV